MTEAQLKKLLNEQTQEFSAILNNYFTYTEGRFAAIETKLEAKADKAQVDRIYTIVDGIAKRLEDDAGEQAIVNHRHESWIAQLAKGSDTKLVPEL